MMMIWPSIHHPNIYLLMTNKYLSIYDANDYDQSLTIIVKQRWCFSIAFTDRELVNYKQKYHCHGVITICAIKNVKHTDQSPVLSITHVTKHRESWTTYYQPSLYINHGSILWFNEGGKSPWLLANIQLWLKMVIQCNLQKRMGNDDEHSRYWTTIILRQPSW